jgi:glycosyltransferase involved in cell wall biosynthesis
MHADGQAGADMIGDTKLTCTVIVPTYNRAQYIGEAIRSLLAQTRKPDQIIVVNDGSTDDTLSVLDHYAGRIEIISKVNGGKATAINMAIPQTRGDCIWIFDDDDVALPDALERHLDALERDGQAGFTYSPILVGHSGDDGRIVVQHGTLLQKVDREEFLIRMMEHCFIHGQPAVVMRTECLKRVGLFDERLVRSQDYEIVLRLARHYPPARVEEPTFIQRRHSGPRGTSSQTYNSADPFAPWSKYNRIFISELLNDLPLTSYVRKSDTFNERTALIQRFVIATRHGILEQAERDLTRIVEGGEELTAEERRILIHSLTHFTALREVGVGSCTRLARLCHGRIGRQIRVTMAKGLIYDMIISARQRRFREAGRLVPRTAVLVGIVGAMEMIARKLRRT